MIDVTRIHSDAGSHIELPLDESWDERTKLEWQAAVVAHDTGLRVRIANGTMTGPGVRGEHYSIQVGTSSMVMNYRDAWLYLVGVSVGVGASQALGDRS